MDLFLAFYNFFLPGKKEAKHLLNEIILDNNDHFLSYCGPAVPEVLNFYDYVRNVLTLILSQLILLFYLQVSQIWPLLTKLQ